MKHWLLWTCIFVFQYVTAAHAGQGNSLLDISTDGKFLACSNRDSGTVTIVKLPELKVQAEIHVGEHPEGVTFLGDSHILAVAVYAEDKVVFLDAHASKPLGIVDVFDEPYGVVSNRAGDRVYVSLDFPGKIVEIDANHRKTLREFSAGKFPRGLALTRDEKQLLTVEYYTADVRAIDIASGREADHWPGSSNDNLARQIAIHPTRGKAYVPHIRSRVTAVHGEGSIFPYVSFLDLREKKDADDTRRRRIPMDAFLGNLVTANTWECTISPDGKQFYVVFAGTDDMFACSVLDDDYREIKNRRYMQVGRNPRAVHVASDNKTVYVYNALDFEVVAYNTESLRIEGRVSVTKYPHGSELLRGKVLFYSALEPMASRRWISCSSCHPDGDPDGRTWHNPEGLRNTQSLAGMSWTHPIHWSADRDEVQDFEHTVRGKLMQGRGLLNGPLQKELGPKNGGRSADLDALAAYSNSHKVPLSPFAKNGLSEAAKRGKEIFFAQETKCAECHSGPLFSDSRPTEAEKIVRHDVGTGSDDPSEKMGPKYDTPSLVGLYRTAPYLHHGKAETLEDLLTRYNQEDRHGRTKHLDKTQVGELVEFLKSLPYEDTEAAAEAAGLQKVIK